MSQEELLKHMENEVEQAVREIREAAEREAETIRREAEERIASMRREMRREAKAESAKRRSLLMHKAHLETRKQSGLARSEWVAQAMQAVADRLKTLRTESGYRDIFSRLAADALREMSDAGRAIVAPDDRELCRTVLQQHGRSAAIECSPEIVGGIILTTEDGKERIVNTLNSRFERSRELLFGILAEELFAGNEGT